MKAAFRRGQVYLQNTVNVQAD